jgi:hypothetical protein
MTGSIHKMISRNARHNAKRVVEELEATVEEKLQRRKRVTERKNIYFRLYGT